MGLVMIAWDVVPVRSAICQLAPALYDVYRSRTRLLHAAASQYLQPAPGRADRGSQSTGAAAGAPTSRVGGFSLFDPQNLCHFESFCISHFQAGITSN